jgi:hypothetical protein
MASPHCRPASRKEALAAAAKAVFSKDLAGRILPFDGGSAAHYAKLVTARRDAGTPIELFDALIAAATLSAGAGLATRDTGGFVGCGLDVVNPWELACPTTHARFRHLPARPRSRRRPWRSGHANDPADRPTAGINRLFAPMDAPSEDARSRGLTDEILEEERRSSPPTTQNAGNGRPLRDRVRRARRPDSVDRAHGGAAGLCGSGWARAGLRLGARR